MALFERFNRSGTDEFVGGIGRRLANPFRHRG